MKGGGLSQQRQDGKYIFWHAQATGVAVGVGGRAKEMRGNGKFKADTLQAREAAFALFRP